jgi:hypothetical protein
MELSPQAVRARREYHRQWRQANKDKIKEYQRRHFEKQAQKMAERQTTNERNG